MSETKSRRLPDWFAKTQPKPLALAVAAASEELDANDKSGAEKWTSNTRKYRPLMFEAVIRRWSELTGYPDDQFPFNDDFVAERYLYWRKLNKENRDILMEQFTD
jgi:hypothetical protein